MKSIPASSAMRASRRQSGQLADQRSGTLVAERPDEQLAPKMPIFSGLALYIAMRSRIVVARASKGLLRLEIESDPLTVTVATRRPFVHCLRRRLGALPLPC